MKNFKLTILFIILSLFFGLAAFAETADPCCMCGKYTEINVPISDINAANNKSGNKKFIGNGNIPTSINFNGAKQLVFSGTQYVYAPVNINGQEHLYLHGSIELEYVNLTGNGTMWLNQNTTGLIHKLVLNGQPKIYVWDESATYKIEGKEYHAGDTIQRNNITITIQKCNTGLPVTFTSLSAYHDKKDIYVNWKVESQINVDHYDIEISKNGIDWVKTAQIKANEQTSTEYTYVDENEMLSLSFMGAFLLMGFYKRKWLVGLTIALIFIACTKEATKQKGEEEIYLRIRSVDKDLNTKVSKAIKVPVK